MQKRKSSSRRKPIEFQVNVTYNELSEQGLKNLAHGIDWLMEKYGDKYQEKCQEQLQN